MIATITTFLQQHRKKIWYASIVGLLGSCFLFWSIWGTQTAYAQESNNNVDQQKVAEKISERSEYGVVFSKSLYIILRPLLVVAGFAMDNSMIYGSLFWFDVALRSIRNLAKNIANFALAFLFIIGLFQVLLGKKENKYIAEVVKRTFIAGILIQASRFITAVAVDISTIATYGIGGLPISVVGTADKLQIPILTSEVFIPMDGGDNQRPKVFLSTAKNDWWKVWIISPCLVWGFEDPGSWRIENVIIGREYLYYIDMNDKEVPTKDLVCHHYGDIYRFKTELFKGNEWWNLSQKQSIHEADIKKFQATYQKDTDYIRDEIIAGTILQIDGKLFGDSKRVFTTNKAWATSENNCPVIDNRLTGIATGAGIDPGKKRLIKEGGTTVKITMLDELLEDSKSYVGVFAALYSSLVDATEFWLTDKVNQWSFPYFINILLNVIYVAALLIPLAVTVIVLLARVIFLRAVVAISPIIILLEVFKGILKETIKIDLGKFYQDHFSLENIGMVLVAPVLIGFAVSICTICMAIIKNIVSSEICTPPATEILGLFEINIAGGGVNLSKLFISAMGVGIVRFLMFAAIKTNSIGRAIGGTVEKTATGIMGNIPIVPLPWGWRVGLNAINPGNPNNILNQFTNRLKVESTKESNMAMASLLWGTDIGNRLYGPEINSMKTAAKQALSEADIMEHIASWKDSYTKTYTEPWGIERRVRLTTNEMISDEAKLFEYINAQTTNQENQRKIIEARLDDESFLASLIEKGTSREKVEKILQLATPKQKEKLQKNLKDRTITRTRNNKKWKLNNDLTLAEVTTEAPTAGVPNTNP